MGRGPAVPRLGRHAAAVLRLHRAAGQRQLVWAELGAVGPHPVAGLVSRRRRRRLLQPGRSHRLHGPVYRVAGRQHEPPRPAQRNDGDHPSACLGVGRAVGAADSGGGGGAAAAAARRQHRPDARRAGAGSALNWNTPILLSPHDPSTIYTRQNRFHQSRDRGTTWTHERGPHEAHQPRHARDHRHAPARCRAAAVQRVGPVHPVQERRHATSTARSVTIRRVAVRAGRYTGSAPTMATSR